MRLLLDMNLSPQLASIFERAGHACSHWSSLGDPCAPDEMILLYAKENDFVLVTHDLDFGAILATTRAAGPSVIQVRGQDLLSQRFISTILLTIERFSEDLHRGALLVVDESRSRVRILPMIK